MRISQYQNNVKCSFTVPYTSACYKVHFTESVNVEIVSGFS
jgi:hypothetical protein